MNLDLPKTPNEDIMKMLIRAKQFLEHAKLHAQSGSEFDTMVAIHNLDNAVEYMLRIIIRHLEIEENTGKTINTCELAQLIGEIQKYLSDNQGPRLSYITELKMIRELRNMVQHAMINPVEDAKIYLNYGERFFEKSLQKYFGIDKSSLRFSKLLKDDFLRNQLEFAENKIDENKYLESIVHSRDAFDYARFLYLRDFRYRIWSAPALSEIKETHNHLYTYLKDMDETLHLNGPMSRFSTS